VDRDKGIIYGVKILGFESLNNRRYLPEAMNEAISLYEGIAVNINHPEVEGRLPTAQRSSYDRFGRIVNVKFLDGEGLFGDLEYLKSHPMAGMVTEAAERMPDAFGLSHNAQGEGDTDNAGTFVIHKITEVRSVDVVADAATNRSLSESRTVIMETAALTKQEKIDLVNELTEAKTVTAKAGKKLLALCEAESQYHDHIFNAMKSLHEAGMDGDETAADKMKALCKSLTADHVSNTGESDNDDKGDEGGGGNAKHKVGLDEDEEDIDREREDDDKSRTKGGDKVESRKRRSRDNEISEIRGELLRLKLEKKARVACEAKGIPATEALIESLTDLGSEAKINRYLTQLVEMGLGGNGGQQRPGVRHGLGGSKPRSRSQVMPVPESRGGNYGGMNIPTDPSKPEELANFLLN
jgi:hypothetical protein